MSGLQFYILDLETNGLRNNYHEIVEISIIRCSDRVQLTEHIKCDFPKRSSLDALRVTGKTLADLENGLPKETVISRVNGFLSKDGTTKAHRCFIGHNIITFDKKFLHSLYQQFNQEVPVDLWMDTFVMMKEWSKMTGLKEEYKKSGKKLSLKLNDCCDLFGIKKYADAHSSKSDTRNNYLLYKYLVDNKNMDYLPFIKNFAHNINSSASEEELDSDLANL